MMVDIHHSYENQSSRSCANLMSKAYTIKLLVADFLLQEELLFSLSVLCTEVPDLLNSTLYNQFVSQLADTKIDMKLTAEPKFSEKELLEVLTALNLNLKMEEFRVFYNVYKSGKTGSVLASLLGTIPKLVRKHRMLEYLLKRTCKKEKKLQKLVKIERSKVRSMYAVVQRAYDAVEKHKSDVGEFLQNENEMKSNELTRTLELTEQSLRMSYRNRSDEMEQRAKILEERELELQSKYQKLEESMSALKIEHERIKQAEFRLETAYVSENDKLQEFQQKFHSLQAQVQELLKTYDAKESDVKDISREPLAENEVLSNMEEYVNLMEKENFLLKFSSNEQRSYIDQLTNEISSLRSRLDYLENEMHIRKHIELKIQRRDVVHALLLSSKRSHPKSCDSHDSIRESTLPSSRRKLFSEDETTQSSEHSSNIAFEETNLTDELVADAKNEIKELENESVELNRNFKSLQSILTRNIALSERKNSVSSSLGSSLPGSSRLSRSFGDLDLYALSGSSMKALSSDTNRRFSPVSQTPPSTRRLNSFRELFMKRKKRRTRSMNSSCSVGEGSSSVFSSPRQRIDDDGNSNDADT